MRTLLCSAAAVVVLALTPAQSMAAPSTQEVIGNGTIQLGVRQQANLNAYTVFDFNDYFGLRYLPTGNDATAPTPSCEGWGVAEADTGANGYARLCDDAPATSPPGTVNLRTESFTATATTAVSTVLVCENDSDPTVCKTGDSPLLRVTHDFRPSAATPNLYDVTVSLENESAHTVEPLYRRVVDWNIEPDTFEEAVLVGGKASPYLLGTSNDGYSSANPLRDRFGGCVGGQGDPPEPCVDPYIEGPPQLFFVSNPTDQGSLFDLALPALAPGGSLQFHFFYGAAGSRNDARSALSAVGADLYALAKPASDPRNGTPNTFTLGFRLAGVSVNNPPPPPPTNPPSTSSPASPSRSPSRATRTPRPPRAKPFRFEVLKHRFRRKKLELTLRCSNECDLTAKGELRLFKSTGKKVLKLRKTKRKLEANAKSKVKLRLTKKAKRALRRASGKKLLTARLSLTVVDGQGKRVKRKPAFPL
jgi:hypothetical protein